MSRARSNPWALRSNALSLLFISADDLWLRFANRLQAPWALHQTRIEVRQHLETHLDPRTVPLKQGWLEPLQLSSGSGEGQRPGRDLAEGGEGGQSGVAGCRTRRAHGSAACSRHTGLSFREAGSVLRLPLYAWLTLSTVITWRRTDPYRTLASV